MIGNTARVYYGQANIGDVDYASGTRTLEKDYKQVDILARRQHIYSSELYFSDPCFFFPTDPCAPGGWLASFDIDPCDNDRFEHDNISLSQWKVVTHNQNYNNQLIGTCFDNTDGRPGIDLDNDNGETLHMLMAQGVGHFQIQWAYFRGAQLLWWPSSDPVGDPCTPGPDFPPEGMFGFYFNMPGGVVVDIDGDGDNDWDPLPGFFPQAIKFKFTLYDSRGIFPEGKTFTHIVYLDD